MFFDKKQLAKVIYQQTPIDKIISIKEKPSCIEVTGYNNNKEITCEVKI